MYNKVIIMGRLTADPELRQTPNNISVTSFTVACDRAYSKSAERQTDFIDCVAWRSTAEFVCRYFQFAFLILYDFRCIFLQFFLFWSIWAFSGAESNARS